MLFIYSLTSSVNLKSDAYCNRIRPHTIIYDRIQQSYSSTEYKLLSLNHSIFLYDLRIRYLFLTVSLRIRCPCTDPVYVLRMSPFFTVNGRLRPCMFDLSENEDATVLDFHGMHIDSLLTIYLTLT